MSDNATIQTTTPAGNGMAGSLCAQRFVRGHNHVTLYNADCRAVLPEIVWDAIVTDPPYGVNHCGNKDRRAKIDRKHFETACARIERECNQGVFDMTPNAPAEPSRNEDARKTK
jgi:tRNA G10  N-methylase Trm11